MKLMIYPASRKVSAFARYGCQVRDCEEIRFVTARGWGTDGADFGTLDGGPPTGIRVSTDFEQALLSVEGVLFPSSPVPMPEKFLAEKIGLALAAGKKVFLESLPEGLRELPGLDRVTLLHGDDTLPFRKAKRADPEIEQIPVPVVFVMGVGPNTNKLEVQVALRSWFLRNGYSVSQVGSSKLSGFFGFDPLPDGLFADTMSTRDKIIALNRYFYKKYEREKPAVMVIGLPGGVMPINPLRFEDLGEMSYLISQAVTPDAAVLCVYAHDYTQAFFDTVRNICRFRLNSLVRHVAVAGVEMSISEEVRKCEYTTVPCGVLQQNYLQGEFEGVELFSALDTGDMERLGASLAGQLQDNL